ncbi:unnamed protein product [Sphagnum troendelagicum]
MKPDTPIDFAIFQLTPTRTRCELLVVCGTESERLAMGLLKPYLEHLKAAEEQVAKGGYSIKLEPPPEYINGIKIEVPWFTKGLMERFVRFVSTPELLERVSIVELELSQIEEAINLQTNDCSAVCLLSSGLLITSWVCYRRRLLRAMDARRLALQKEQGMAFARAGAAGFDMQYLAHLSVFADCFGATRLGDACDKFMALCNKRKEAILWMEEMELATADAAVFAPTPPHVISKDQYMDMWKDAQGGEADILHVEEGGSNVSHSSPIGSRTSGDALPSASAMEGMVSDHGSLSGTEPDGPFPSHSKHLAKHSTSPNMSSSSPLRRVQVGRSGMRQSGVVVIRNINYFTNPGENAEKGTVKDYSEASESLDETDSAVGDEDDGPKLRGRGNLSVKDAISLFEVKRRGSLDSTKTRVSKQGICRDSTDNVISEKPVLRRWSTTAAELASEPCTTSEKSDQLNGSDNSSGMDMEAEAHMSVQTSKNSGSSAPLEEVFILPDRHANCLVQTCYSGTDSNFVQPLGTHPDDMFMIPKRSRQTSGTDKLLEVNQDHEMVLIDKSELTDESFIMPARVQAQELSALGWRSELHLDSEITSNQGNTMQSKQMTPAPEEFAVARPSPQKSTTRLLRGSVSNLAPAALPKSSQIFQRRASTVPSTASNPLSKSVPSFAAFRKENTKPSAVRSSSAFDRGSLMKNNSVPARRASTAPLEANRGQPSGSRSSSTLANHADKKRLSSFGTRKSVSGFKTELSQEVQNSVRGKVSKAVGVEQKELATKMTKRVSATPTAALNTKPFLRKGRGTTQGAMPAARKLKAVSAADSTLESHVNGQTLSPEFVVAGDEVLSSFTPTAAEQSPAHSQIHGSALTSSSPLAYIAPPAMMSSSPISTSTQAQSAPAEVCSVPLAMVTDSSPKYNNPIPIVSSSVDALQSLPVPQASLSPEEVGNTSSSGHLQKLSGSSEKLVLTHDKGIKESPRGLRKLLKFRRKSRDSSSHANDWRSASATSQGDEDIEATSEAGFLGAVVRMDKGRRFGSKSSRRASLPSNVSIDIDNESSSGLTVRNSVSTPPSDSKMLDRKSSGGSSGKGMSSRSFFAAFRSKSNEPKS